MATGSAGLFSVRADQVMNSRFTMLFRPDGGEAILTSDAVAVDQLEPVALTHKLIEGRLILLRGEAVAGLPGGCACRLTPDRSVEIPRAVEVAAYPVEQVALARELVESCLIIRRSEAVTGDPGIGSALLEDACETGAVVRGIAVDEHRVIALAGELIEGGLIIGGGQAVASLPGERGGSLDPERCIQGEGRAVPADVDQLHSVVSDIVIEGLLILLRREAVAGDPSANGNLRADVIEVDVGYDIAEELRWYADRKVRKHDQLHVAGQEVGEGLLRLEGTGLPKATLVVKRTEAGRLNEVNAKAVIEYVLGGGRPSPKSGRPN